MQGTNTLTCSKTLANDSTQSVHKRQGLAKLSVCIPEQSKLGPEKISCKSMFVFMQRGPFHNQKPQSLISCTSSLVCILKFFNRYCSTGWKEPQKQPTVQFWGRN